MSEGRLSSWCKAGEHLGCSKKMIGVDGKHFRCVCICHPTIDAELEAKRKQRLKDQKEEGDDA